MRSARFLLSLTHSQRTHSALSQNDNDLGESESEGTPSEGQSTIRQQEEEEEEEVEEEEEQQFVQCPVREEIFEEVVVPVDAPRAPPRVAPRTEVKDWLIINIRGRCLELTTLPRPHPIPPEVPNGFPSGAWLRFSHGGGSLRLR